MKEIIIGYSLAFLITIISSLIYTLLGFKNLTIFINNHLIFILLLYYLTTIIYLYRKNKIREEKILFKDYFPQILLGISFATVYNMIVFKNNPPIINNSNPLILLILSTGIIGPIFEEILFRYIFYNRLKKKFSVKVSIIINSILFSLIHLSIVNMIYAFILGIILTLSYEKYKNIMAPILVHISGNLIVLFLTEYNELILVLSLLNLLISIYLLKQRN